MIPKTIFLSCHFLVRMVIPLNVFLCNYYIEEERRCNTRSGKPFESLSEAKCPLEALRGFFFSRNSHSRTSSPLRGSGIFSGYRLVVTLRRCTSVSLGLQKFSARRFALQSYCHWFVAVCKWTCFLDCVL